ncbi:MAG: hypothetical protein WD023_00895 [Ilumatobacteraceae bacterium]
MAMLAVTIAGCGKGSSEPSEADLLDPTKSPLAKLMGYDISPAEQKVEQLAVE